MDDHCRNLSFWDYFDKFFCISLSQRKDRRDSAAVQFAKVGLDHRVEYLIVEEHPENSEQGIYESHMACVRKGIQSGAERVAIFEDDVLFNDFNPVRMSQCIDYIKTVGQWEILFLGCLVSGSRRTQNPAVLRINYRCSAHAYILNRPFAEELVKKQWSGTPFDTLLKDFAKHTYAIYPAVAFQSDARSDNHRRKGLEIFRRIFGGYAPIQKANELFHHYRTAIIFLHLLVVLVIIGWLIKP